MDNLQNVLSNYDNVLSEVKALSPEATLVLASKMVDKEVLEGLAAARPGVIYGENRVQELLSKHFEAPGLTWQFIGRLQTNKVKYIVGKVVLIHSVDSYKLAEAINDQAAKAGCIQDILLEMNLAGEESKFGSADPEINRQLIRDVSGLDYVRLCGLMTVAPYVEDPEENRVYFRQLRDMIYGDMREYFPEKPLLSMGMSGDYKVAVEEGATHVRVGSSIFGERSYNI